MARATDDSIVFDGAVRFADFALTDPAIYSLTTTTTTSAPFRAQVVSIRFVVTRVIRPNSYYRNETPQPVRFGHTGPTRDNILYLYLTVKSPRANVQSPNRGGNIRTFGFWHRLFDRRAVFDLKPARRTTERYPTRAVLSSSTFLARFSLSLSL